MAKESFELLNLCTNIIDFTKQEEGEKRISFLAQRLESVLGDVVLMSDGKIKRGYNPNLIKEQGSFHIEEEEQGFRLTGPYRKLDFFSRIACVDDDVYLGSGFSKNGVEMTGVISRASIFSHPLYTINGLYQAHGVSVGGFLFSNINKKIAFLEDFLDKPDYKTAMPREEIAKQGKEVLLSRLENNYYNNIAHYAIRDLSPAEERHFNSIQKS